MFKYKCFLFQVSRKFGQAAYYPVTVKLLLIRKYAIWHANKLIHKSIKI